MVLTASASGIILLYYRRLVNRILTYMICVLYSMKMDGSMACSAQKEKTLMRLVEIYLVQSLNVVLLVPRTLSLGKDSMT
ncbi:hypothetical protein D3C73_1162870 [compost metagenome]